MSTDEQGESPPPLFATLRVDVRASGSGEGCGPCTVRNSGRGWGCDPVCVCSPVLLLLLPPRGAWCLCSFVVRSSPLRPSLCRGRSAEHLNIIIVVAHQHTQPKHTMFPSSSFPLRPHLFFPPPSSSGTSSPTTPRRDFDLDSAGEIQEILQSVSRLASRTGTPVAAGGRGAQGAERGLSAEE